MDWLKAILGETYTEELEKKISAQIGKDFVARADFNAANEVKKSLTAQIKERDDQLEELKKVDADGLQQKIKDLQADNQKQSEQHEAQLHETKFQAALGLALAGSGAKNTKALQGMLDMDKIKFEGDVLNGFDDQLAAIKESEGYLFEQEAAATGMAHGATGQGDPFVTAAIRIGTAA